MALTEPQFDLLSHLGSTETGLEMEFVRGERGRTSVRVGDRTFQPRTARALVDANLVEMIAVMHDEPKDGEVFEVWRLSPSGWNALGIPVQDTPAPEAIEINDYTAKKDAENDAPLRVSDLEVLEQPKLSESPCGQSYRARYTNKHRCRADEKARRKRERASRRINRVRK